MGIEEFAEKFIQAENEAWQNGNFDALEALENPDVIYHMKMMKQDLVGWEAHKQSIMDLRQGASEFTQEWDYIVGDGNVFVLSYKSNAKLATAIPDMSLPSGTTVSSELMCVFRLVNNKVAEAWLHGASIVD